MKKLTFIAFCVIFLFLNVSGQERTPPEKRGIYMGLNAGTWLPIGKNKVLGNPMLFGFSVDFRYEKNVYGMSFDMIGWRKNITTEPITIAFEDSLYVTSRYNVAHFTLNYGRELWSTETCMIEGICGIGYGDFSYDDKDKETDISKSSLVIDPGISFRYIFGKKLFIQLRAQYCMANYNMSNKLTTDLRGNYLITKLVVGSKL